MRQDYRTHVGFLIRSGVTMHVFFRYAMAVLGLGCLVVAIWQWHVNTNETKADTNTEDGKIIWALPTQIRRLGNNITYLAPRTIVTFETKVTYPSKIREGHAFQVLLESKVFGIKPSGKTGNTQDKKVVEMLNEAFHTFELELPGLNVLPKGANQFGVDDKVRWQIAPPRDPGIYKGYIRPRGGTAAILGAEYAVRWSNPGDFELEIHVNRSFKFLEKLESLIFGFLGSLLSFPAVLALYRSFWPRKNGE